MQFNVRDVATIFNVPESTVYRWINEDNLPTVEMNGQCRFDRTELLEWATVRRLKFSPALFQGTPIGATARLDLVEALEAGKIVYHLHGKTREEALAAVVEHLPVPQNYDRNFLLQLFLARESSGSTAVGDGIAIPHPRHPVVLPIGKAMLNLCFLEHPVDFGAADRQPVHTLFVLISPTIRVHLQMLARISFLLRDASFREVLKRRDPPEEVLEGVRRVEATFVEPGAPGRPSEPA